MGILLGVKILCYMAMIKSFRIKDFGCIQEICVDSLSNLNVVVGPNSAGKSTLLKLLYATIKSAEMFKRGKDDKSYQVLLGEKLRWVFQVDSLAELVRVGKGNFAELEVETLYETIKMRLTPERGLRLDEQTNPSPREVNSVFIPAKEVISIQSIINKARFVNQTFGFDETYEKDEHSDSFA